LASLATLFPDHGIEIQHITGQRNMPKMLGDDKVKKEFVKAIHMSPVDATEHVLQLTGTTIQPDAHDHIGSLVGEHCSVAFVLVPKIRPQG